MARLSLSLLGPFQATLDGEPITSFPSVKVRALLAYLAVESDHPHPREVLAGLLWPDYPERSAHTNLSNALSHLRTLLKDRADTQARPYILVDRETVQFNPDSDAWVDVTAFADLTGGERVRSLADLSGLEEAASLYRGPFLDGFSLRDSPAFEQWVLVTRERLQRLAMEALGRLTAQYEERGESERAIDLARRQLELEPWDEAAHQAVMRLLAQSGRRADALAQYEACRRVLSAELGMEPSAETTALAERIRGGEAERAGGRAVRGRERAAEGERAAGPGLSQAGLPSWLTTFVGREELVTEIQARLSDPGCRLLTLIGPGGCGKTRLAVEAARGDGYGPEAFFVSLAPLQSVEAIVPTIAQAVGLSFNAYGEPRQQLLDYLRTKRMLLLLDNFEHLLSVGVGVVSDILQAAPGIKALVTSRAALGLQGEELLPVPGMSYPALTPGPSATSTRGGSPGGRGEDDDAEVAQYGAVQLFTQAARRVRPGFEPASEELEQVVELCRLVEGMPLALLLAAAWMRLLSPGEIVAEVRHSLDFLEAEQRDLPERQRSMRAAFDYSWRLLSERERQIFAALSVFRGGFTRAAALEVAGATLRDLMGLANQSLITLARTGAATPDSSLRQGRYDIHELLRQYAQDRLREAPAVERQVRDRHTATYVAALQRWATDIKGPRQVAAVAELEVEIANARAAWDWAVEQGQAEALGRAAEGLGLFYTWRARREEAEAAFRTAADGLAKAGQPVSAEAVRARVRVLAWLGSIHYTMTFEPESAMRLYQQSLDLLREPGLDERSILADKAFVLREMGQVSSDRGDLERSRSFGEQSLALYRASGDRWGQATVLLDLGERLNRLRVRDEAERLNEESLALRRELGDLRGIATTAMTVGYWRIPRGALEESERLAHESIAICHQVNNRGTLGQALFLLGWSLYLQGRFAEALATWEECHASSDLGFSRTTVQFAWARVELGQYDEARAAAQEMLHVPAQTTHLRRWLGMAYLELGRVALAGRDDAAAQDLIQQAIPIVQEMRYDNDVGEALILSGIAALRLGQLAGARQYLAKALHVGIEAHHRFVLARTTAGTALLLARQGETERAVELYALAARDPLIAHSRWYEDVVGRPIAAAAAAALPPEAIAAAQERGRARDPWATAEELLQELERE